MGSIRPRWRTFATAMLAVVIGIAALPPLQALAQAQTPPVEEARALYEQAKFGDAITLLRSALSAGQVTGANALAARELIARCLVRSGNRLEAKEAFKGLLHLNPSYRPAAGAMPPDEAEVFRLALDEFQSEQIEAGERVPASLSFMFGVGSGDNKDFGEIVAAAGGDDKYDVDPNFGAAVRFPIMPRWSLELEMQRFRATDSDTFKTTYEITAIPLSLSVYYAAITNPKWRVNVFAGIGSMLAATSTIKLDSGTSSVGLALSDQKSGFYGHAGLEGEYLLHPRVAVYGRLLGRAATVSGLFSDTDLTLFTVPLKDREVNFSGFGAHVGLRGYIGY